MTERDPRIALLVVALLAALVAAAPRPAAAQPQELPARIVTISGRVEAWRPGSTWAKVVLRDEVGEGQGVRTGNGRLTLLTASNQAFRLGSQSQLFFITPAPPQGPTRARLDKGWLWLAVIPSSPAPTHVDLRAGPVTITARGGGVSVFMSPDGSVLVSVYHGAATVAGEEWQRLLVQDQEALIPPAGPPKEITVLKREKRNAEWLKWNEQQDKAGDYGARVEKK